MPKVSQGDRDIQSSAKRVRQACSNCRRKKARCPGEKPECSYCTRLQQKCTYSTNDRAEPSRHHAPVSNNHCSSKQSVPSHIDNTRLESIETYLQPLTNVSNLVQQRAFSDISLPDDVISEGVALYFTNHCNQPCPILDHLLPNPSPYDLPPVVLSALLALSLRSSTHAYLADKNRMRTTLDTLAQLAWNQLIKAYATLDCSNSYLQGLCLLAQVDYAEGKVDRARAQLALGLTLAQARGMLDKEYAEQQNLLDGIRCREIVWTLFILERMFISGRLREPSVRHSSFKLARFQGGPSLPSEFEQPRELSDLRPPRKSPNIVALGIEIMRIWELVITDVYDSPDEGAIPFWRNDSPRSAILSSLLEFELHSEQHTYASIGPATIIRQKPQLRRYFLSWLYFQFVHSAIHCCLCHPFIIYTKTQTLKGRVPLTFLQHSCQTSMIYANWVYKFIVETELAGLTVHSPFLGYLVAITASIHMEHGASKHAKIAASAKQKFQACLLFLRKLSLEWPKLSNSVEVLEHLKLRLNNRSNINYVEDDYDGGVPVRSARQVSITEDERRLMWKLFDFASTTEPLQHSAVEASELSSTAVFDHPLSEFPDNAQFPLPVTAALTGELHPDAFGSTEANDGLFEPMESFMGDWSDWSLFGRPWQAYFPPEDELSL